MSQSKAACRGLGNLSRLPDELLLCIISLLSPKDAVRTSVLSKSWRYLYASTSTLEFPFKKLSRGRETKLTDIMNFVDRVFFYRNRCSIINRFQISWGNRDAFDPLRVQGWINCMMWHGIREIDICVPANLMLPASLFTCETLVELHLSMNSRPASVVPAKVYLPSLKVLELLYVISFPNNDDASERLLNNCPVLERFDCSFGNGDCKLVVCHPTLKRLSIREDREFGSWNISINAPSLAYLECVFFDVDSFTLINSQDLTEANIYIHHDGDDDELYTLCATNLMRGISNVHKLVITGGTVETLLENNVPLPVFQNLTHFEFSDNFFPDFGFSGVVSFLGAFNYLETLCFAELPPVFDLDEQEEPSANCWLFRLKTIMIASFRGNSDEMDMVKYLLQSARVLEVLDIAMISMESSKIELEMCEALNRFPRARMESPEEKLEMCRMLSTFPRASKTCNVVFKGI